MLVKVPTNWELLQVEKEEEHPDCGIFGYMACPVCGSHLHGHGWRRRYLEKEWGEFIRVWVHRKRCPHCRRTYTLIAEGMSAKAQYTIDRIRDALSTRQEGHRSSSGLGIPLRTQKLWWRNFMRRTKAEVGMTPTAGEISAAIAAADPITVLPLSYSRASESAIRGVTGRRCGGPHHIMYLPHRVPPW